MGLSSVTEFFTILSLSFSKNNDAFLLPSCFHMIEAYKLLLSINEMAKTWKETGVVVTVYVETQQVRRRLSSSSSSTSKPKSNVHRLSKNGKKYYNRKAELLNYSRQLRQSSAPTRSSSSSSSPLPANPLSSNNNNNNNSIPAKNDVTKISSKSKGDGKPTTCWGKWGDTVSSFLRSLTTINLKKKKKKKKRS